MPGFIHRLFGKDDHECDELKQGPTLWDKGSPDGWYYHSKASGIGWKKWWSRSLPAHIGLELALYIGLYYIIHIIYQFGLDEKSVKKFEDLVDYFNESLSTISKDLTFLLGFYVSQIVRRWWDRYKLLPWPDSLVLLSHGLVDYQAEKSVEFFKTIMRYSMLSYILCIRRISKALRKMFPSNQSLVETRVATKKELNLLESQGDLGRVWWIPLSWSMTMIRNSKENKFIPSDQKILIDNIAKFQVGLEKVDDQDHIILPPLYKQVVKFAVYVYFALSLIGSQEVNKDAYTFIPIFLVLKFIFFFGWLEVAEAIANPFGNDDDDFQICELVSRHLWAIGKNVDQFRGPPKLDDDDDEPEDSDNSNIVTINFDTNKKH